MSDTDIKALADEIRRIFSQDPNDAPARVERLLKERWDHQGENARLASLQRLAREFGPLSKELLPVEAPVDAQIFAMVLGHEAADLQKLPADVLLAHLAEALNTVFDALNHLVGNIDRELTGEPAGDQTIRHSIGRSLCQYDRYKTLQAYVEGIDTAFLIVHQAFQQAARQKVQQILEELSPQKTIAECGGGLRVGLLKRAEAFDLYDDKYKKILQWFQSPRFERNLLREFQSQCRKQFEKQGGNKL